MTTATRTVPFVDLGAQYGTIREEIEAAMARVLERHDFVLGEELSLFEDEFASFCGAKYGVGVDSGTSALELALRACGIGRGDEVITTANTFIATALAISSTGARPVLVDIDPRSYNMSPDLAEAAITSRTRALIPVHLYGLPADMGPLLKIAERYGLKVIEDACQAHGARYGGQRVGSLGHAAAFSFYPAKNLGAYGDGGMVVTNDESMADALRLLRNYGQREKYHHLSLGYNHRLDTLQAGVLRVKLRYLEGWNASRRGHALRYGLRLADCPVGLPFEPPEAQSVYHLYVLRVHDRDRLRGALQQRGISTGIHYPVPIHRQPCYQELGYPEGSFPVTEAYAGQILSLPMYAELTGEMIDYVASTIRKLIGTDGSRNAPAA